ncbi:uncharacterized protein LOC111270416 isoform X1 [Varroa jacobsoni]|uniref:uncharacterized protein LOC111270416 isoform X1 n=1 Tax=Varroa jacobsoni TaxID=62625 RepID=UPI000BF78A77|nr:uncharacterized protein LOC111270416 isoform X1 [Varroa jacobsoni]
MADLLYEYWSTVEESLLEFWYMTITPVFDEINDIVSQYDFLPLLGVCLWHVDLVVVPTLTRVFAFLSVVAASYPSYLEAENFEGPMGKLSHNIVGTLFRYETSMDAMFCILNFVYKGIILEARMGTKRFFNMLFLLALAIGVLKSALEQAGMSLIGGIYPLLLSLKVIINYTCLFHHPVRYPIFHPFLVRRLRFLEYFIALIRTRSPQDVLVGVGAGTTLIVCLNDPKSLIHPLLGEDGSKVTAITATKLIFRGHSGGIYRFVKSVTPDVITSLWLAFVLVSYNLERESLPEAIEPFWVLETFNPEFPITWLLPTTGVTGINHLFYLLFLVYRTPATFRSAFKDFNASLLCFFSVLPLSRLCGLMLANTAKECEMFDLYCLDFPRRISDSCTVLVAANTFAEIILLAPDNAGKFICRILLEMAMIWKFFPDIYIIELIGAYGASGFLACLSLIIDKHRDYLADPLTGTRKADVLVRKNPRRQLGSVTESSPSVTPPEDLTPPVTVSNPPASGGRIIGVMKATVSALSVVVS